jgi:hypothetical protein
MPNSAAQHENTLFDDLRRLVESGDFRKVSTGAIDSTPHLLSEKAAKILEARGVQVGVLGKNTIRTSGLSEFDLGDMTHQVSPDELTDKLGGHVEYVQATQGAKDLKREPKENIDTKPDRGIG